MGKCTVATDLVKNRLDFTYTGRLTCESLLGAQEDLNHCIDELKSGFDVVSDFSDCECIYRDSFPVFREMMSTVAGSDVREVVRVIGEEQLVYKQTVNYFLNVPTYRPICVGGKKEAEVHLGKEIRRKEIRFSLGGRKIEFIYGGVRRKVSIVDISTSGVSLAVKGEKPHVGEVFEVKLELLSDESSIEEFNIKALAVRCSETLFAAEFMDLGADRKMLLRRCLVFAARP